MKKKSINKKYDLEKIVIIVLNVIGTCCLLYLLIPYLIHDMSITNPDSMLSGYRWDICGFLLTIGFIPLCVVNILAYIYIDNKNNIVKYLYFIPSIICLIIVSHYLFFECDWKEKKVSNPVTTINCIIDDKSYSYQIYESDNEYSLGMDEKDNFPISIVNYTDIESITKSIEQYYNDNGGRCS